MRKLYWLLLLLLAVTTLEAQNYTQGYTQVVVFGDSLSDTGNIARAVQNAYVVRYPGPLFGYTDGRFTDGTDTSPAARMYNGVWLEQLAATLTPVPAVKASLDGGTNYAYGGATNANTSQMVSFGQGVSIPVPNVGAQIAAYLATKPAITAKTLFVVWGGSNDLLRATSAAAAPMAEQSAIANLQALIAAGGTQFIVPNLAPLGAIPQLNTTPANAAAATALAMAYNSLLALDVAQLSTANPALKIYSLDTFSLFNAILPSPAVSGFANVTNSAQGVTSINPDTYLFWDGMHPTTYGHYLLSRYARNLLTQTTVATTTLALSATTASPRQTVTLTARTTSAAAATTPTGLVTFYSGNTPLATASLDTTGMATTTLVAALAQSPYQLTARYLGDATFFGTSFASATLTVSNPGYTLSASPATITVMHGSAGSSTLTLTPTGNLTGTFTPSCGALPMYVTCSFSSPTLTAANNVAVTSTVSFGTSVTAANNVPVRPGSAPSLPVYTALALLGGAGLAARRQRVRVGLLGLVALLGATTLGGCGGGSAATGLTTHTAAAGTYTIPITLTPALAGSSNMLSITLVVQ